MESQPRRPSRLRQLIPWVVGIAIIVVIALQVPFAKFRESFGSGAHWQLALVELVCTVAALATDSVSTWIGLRTVNIRWPLWKVGSIRGATYLLVLLNYAVGQGGFGYYLYRAGEPAKRAVGVTLYLLGTTLATLLTVAFAVWLIAGVRSGAEYEEMWWSIVVAMCGFGAYLVVIATRLRLLAQREILAPLFEAGVGGHVITVLARVPHVFIIVFTYWLAMWAWGIDVPFGTAMTLMPAIVLAAVLPISPGGLGTTQAALVFFFAIYAPGATDDARTANVLAFGIAQFVYATLATLLVGVVCLPIARRTGLIAKAEKPA